MAVFVLNNYNPIRTFEKNTIMSKDKKGVYTGIASYMLRVFYSKHNFHLRVVI